MTGAAGQGGGQVAILAGTGLLPRLLAETLEAQGTPPVLAGLEGLSLEALGDRPVQRFRIERLMPFLDHLHAQGVRRVILAGAVRRPRLDPEAFDPRTAALVPRLAAALGAGDDAALRIVIEIIEEDGFAVLGAHDIAPDLVPGPGVLTARSPDAADRADADRAARIVAALGAVDVGQGAVVARGLCLALEALPGTDAMLEHVAQMRARFPDAPAGGLLFKAPKPGQELRADMPALGPDAVRRAAGAGLRGIAWQAGGVLLLDRAATVAAADAAGLFLWARDSGGDAALSDRG